MFMIQLHSCDIYASSMQCLEIGDTWLWWRNGITVMLMQKELSLFFCNTYTICYLLGLV